MTREAIEKKVMEIAAEQGAVALSAITPGTHFVNDLNFDSLTTVEFTMELEDEFEISVPDEQIPNLQTVSAVVDYVAEHTAAGAERP